MCPLKSPSLSICPKPEPLQNCEINRQRLADRLGGLPCKDTSLCLITIEGVFRSQMQRTRVFSSGGSRLLAANTI